MHGVPALPLGWRRRRCRGQRRSGRGWTRQPRRIPAINANSFIKLFFFRSISHGTVTVERGTKRVCDRAASWDEDGGGAAAAAGEGSGLHELHDGRRRLPEIPRRHAFLPAPAPPICMHAN